MRRLFQPPACRQDAEEATDARGILMLVFISIAIVGIGFVRGKKLMNQYQSRFGITCAPRHQSK